MTAFVVRGSASASVSVDDVEAKFNACVDWVRLRAEGLTLEPVSFDLPAPEPKTWALLADPATTTVLAEGCNGIVFVEVYRTLGDCEQVFHAVADQHVTNAGDLRVTLRPHDEPWLVRVVRP